MTTGGSTAPRGRSGTGAVGGSTRANRREATTTPPKSAFMIYFKEKEVIRAREDEPPRKKTMVDNKKDIPKTKSEWLPLPRGGPEGV